MELRNCCATSEDGGRDVAIECEDALECGDDSTLNDRGGVCEGVADGCDDALPSTVPPPACGGVDVDVDGNGNGNGDEDGDGDGDEDKNEDEDEDEGECEDEGVEEEEGAVSGVGVKAVVVWISY